MRIIGRAFVGEVLGTLLLVLLTVGSAANAVLQPRLSPGAYGYDSLALGSGLAVLVGVLASRFLSGAHLNPAVTLALAAGRLFPWRLVPLYLVAQLSEPLSPTGKAFWPRGCPTCSARDPAFCARNRKPSTPGLARRWRKPWAPSPS